MQAGPAVNRQRAHLACNWGRKADHQSDRMSPAVHARREDSLQITMAHRQPASGPALVHSHTRTAAAYAHINATVPCRYISGKHGSPAGRASGAHARHTVPGHCRLPPYVLKDDNDDGKERPPGAAEPSDDGQSPAGIKCRHRGRALRPTTAERGPWPRSLEKWTVPTTAGTTDQHRIQQAAGRPPIAALLRFFPHTTVNWNIRYM